MCAWGLGGFAKVTHQRGRQHILYQARLARTADARDGDQTLQRKVHIDVLQVVLASTFQNQTRRAVGHHALEAQAHLLAPAQVGTCERVGVAQVGGRAVKHNLSATLAGAGAHVDHAVGRQHHGRVVLHHHQCVARVAQAVHGLGDAAHVTRVKTDAGLIEHKQGVHQRGAQGRGQVDALHLAPTEGAALAVEREVADAHIAQVFQARGDFFEQQLQRLRLGVCRSQCHRAGAHAVKESAQLVNRHDHHVVQAQAWQRFQLRS